MPAYTEKGTLEKGVLQKKGFSWQNKKGKAVLALRRDMTQVNSVKDEVRVRYEARRWGWLESRQITISLDLARSRPTSAAQLPLGRTRCSAPNYSVRRCACSNPNLNVCGLTTQRRLGGTAAPTHNARETGASSHRELSMWGRSGAARRAAFDRANQREPIRNLVVHRSRAALAPLRAVFRAQAWRAAHARRALRATAS